MLPVDNNSIVATLNGLIGTCKDGESGYQTAADCVKNPELKTLFLSCSRERGKYAGELQNEVRQSGGDPEKGGSLAGVLWRGWTNLKATVTGGSETAIVAECERAEDAAEKTYAEALKGPLPEDVQALIQRQSAGIKESHERLRALHAVLSKRG